MYEIFNPFSECIFVHEKSGSNQNKISYANRGYSLPMLGARHSWTYLSTRMFVFYPTDLK